MVGIRSISPLERNVIHYATCIMEDDIQNTHSSAHTWITQPLAQPGAGSFVEVNHVSKGQSYYKTYDTSVG